VSTRSGGLRREGATRRGRRRREEERRGSHITFDIEFTPEARGDLQLNLVSAKRGQEQLRDSRQFVVVE
jgi:hypothetical protein